MFSVMYTGMCCLPLWTAIVRPMKSGRIVERRDLGGGSGFHLLLQMGVDERALLD
jgi:hypothetical protein